MSADQTFYERAAEDEQATGAQPYAMAIAEGLQAICYEIRTANLIAFRQHVGGYEKLDAELAARLEIPAVFYG